MLKKKNKIHLFSNLIASIVLLIGLINFSFHHISHDYFLNFYPLPYLSSVLLILTGLALLNLFNFKSLSLVRALGVAIVLITGIEEFSQLFHINLHIDFLEKHALPSTPLLSSLGFFIIGLIFILFTRSETKLISYIDVLLCFIVFFLGFIGIVNLIMPLEISITWQHIFSIHFYASLSFMLTSLSLMFALTPTLLESRLRHTWVLPFFLSLSFFIFVLLFSFIIILDRREVAQKQLEDKLKQFKYIANKELNELAFDFLSIQNEIESRQSIDVEFLKKALIRPYVNSFGWLTNDLSLTQVIPSENEKDVSKKLTFLKDQKDNLEKSEKLNNIFTYFPEVNEQECLYLFFPISWNHHEKGFLFEELNLKKFFEYNFLNQLSKFYVISIFHNGKKLFDLNQKKFDSTLFYQDSLQFENIELSVKIFPTDDLLERYISSFIFYFIVFGGIFTSVCIGLLVYFWQMALLKIKELKQAEKQYLEAKNSKLIALQSARLGTWEYNLENQLFIWDEYMFTLFGISSTQSIVSIDNFLNYVHPSDRTYVSQSLQHSFKEGKGINLIFRIKKPTGAISTLFFKGELVDRELSKTKSIVGMASDISQIELFQSLLTTSQGITEALSISANLKEALTKIIIILENNFGWGLMFLWKWDEESESLTCIEFAHVHSFDCRAFIEATLNLKWDKTHSIPNQIWATYLPFVISDIANDKDYIRKEAAKQDNIKSLLAFPLYEGQKLTGVVELYRKETLVEKIDDRILNLMTAMGIGIGQFIQRRSAEEARAKLAAIVTYSINGIYSTDIDGYINSWNEGCEKTFGWTEEEMLHQHITKIYPQEKLHECETVGERLLQGLSTEFYQTERRKKDGSHVWVSIAVSPIKDDFNKVIGACGISKDITFEKEVVMNLKKSEEKYRMFVETTQDWVWEINAQDVILYSNPAIKHILGYPPSELIGKSLSFFVFNHHRLEFEKILHENIEKKRGFSRELLFLDREGKEHWLMANAEPILENFEVIGFRGTCHDITEIRRIEKLKNELTSVVCHELKTPLTSIHGALGLLSGKDLESKVQKELINVAFRNSERLTHIINDLLDIDKITSGRLKLVLKVISINDVVKEAIHASKPLLDKSGIRIHLDEKGNFKVHADFGRLVQVMMNLLSNAIKFSPTGGVINVAIFASENYVRVSVQDQGPGIAEAYKSRIFEKFTQADLSARRISQGAGLGLHISKKIIDSHQGTLSYVTKENEGSTFYFDLPIAT